MNRVIMTAVAATVSAGVMLAAGCYNPPPSREYARTLSTQVSAYRDTQKKRIDLLNQSYNERYAELSDALQHAFDAELGLGRDADAQRIADDLVENPFQSLNGRFRQGFGSAVAEQRKRIVDADVAIAAVRGGYMETYREAKLELGELDKTLDRLRTLSADEKERETLAQILRSLVDAYEKARKAATQPAAKPAA
jgi:hypothetical protein